MVEFRLSHTRMFVRRLIYSQRHLLTLIVVVIASLLNTTKAVGEMDSIQRLRTPIQPIEFTSTTTNSISFQWPGIPGNRIGYIIERRALNGSWQRLAVTFREADLTAVETFAYVDTDVSSDTYYCYRIIAFTDSAFTISPEACSQTDSRPEIVEMRRVPHFLSPNRLELYPDLIAGGETVPCLDPEIQAAIELAQELLAEHGGNVSSTKYACEGSSWGIEDLVGFFDDFTDFLLSRGLDTLICTGRGLAVLAACPGLLGVTFLSCIANVAGGGECPIEVCRTNEVGIEHCTEEQGPCWLTSCLLVVPTTLICVEAAKSFDSNCLSSDSEIPMYLAAITPNDLWGSCK